jgi:putative ABC transport system ATP-binding protein
MIFRFNQVIPAPLTEALKSNTHQTQIWQAEVKFESPQNYQVSAISGKGKSTFIHILYGLRSDFSGEVWLDDKKINQISENEWAKIRQTRLSIVFQDLRLFMELTALENIMVKAFLQKKTTPDNIQAMAEQLGVAHILNKKAKLLSYGERQRIAIIRALQQPFEFLLLDEPFSHLDPENIAKAGQLIQQKCLENQAGIIMTSLGYEYNLPINAELKL